MTTLSFADRITAVIDQALERERAQQPAREYLGASRLGVACDRVLQFELTHTPKDPGREFPGRLLRVFEAGHAYEAMAIRWLQLAGFDLQTRQADGTPFGFAVADERIQGHIDGVLWGGPPIEGLHYPALWECKSMQDRSWNDTVKRGVVLAEPTYAGQMALYQAYLADRIPGIADNPALFTSANKNTQALHFESVPFDLALAQRMSDRGVRVLQATEAEEWLPRLATQRTHFECRVCAWQDRCWSTP